MILNQADFFPIFQEDKHHLIDICFEKLKVTNLKEVCDIFATNLIQQPCSHKNLLWAKLRRIRDEEDISKIR